MLTIVPDPRATIAGRHASTSRIGENTLIRSRFSPSSGGVPIVGPTICTPALLTSTSMSPTSAASDVARAGSPRSAAMTRCASPSSAASLSRSSRRRATSTSRAPARASPRAMASPMPAGAPVTGAGMAARVRRPWPIANPEVGTGETPKGLARPVFGVTISRIPSRTSMRRSVAGAMVAVLWSSAAPAASTVPPPEAIDKSVAAVRVDKAPVIDGRLDDAVWALAQPTGGFVQQFPHEREPAPERTEFRVLYDDKNVYVGVECSAPEPDKIAPRLTRRDRDIEADWVAVTVDSRHSRDSAFLFQLSAAGVMVDGQFTNDSNFSYEWDGVWEGASAIGAQGWSAEFRIPLTQLRFSDEEEQTWGIQVHRGVSRKRERSMWVFI